MSATIITVMLEELIDLLQLVVGQVPVSYYRNSTFPFMTVFLHMFTPLVHEWEMITEVNWSICEQHECLWGVSLEDWVPAPQRWSDCNSLSVVMHHAFHNTVQTQRHKPKKRMPLLILFIRAFIHILLYNFSFHCRCSDVSGFVAETECESFWKTKIRQPLLKEPP